MSLVGWILFILSQAAILVLAAWGAVLLSDGSQPLDKLDVAIRSLSLAGIGLLIIDVLVMVGIIGRGWPPSTKTSTELFAAVAIVVLIAAVTGFTDDGKHWLAVSGFFGLFAVVLLEVLLVTNVVWRQAGTASPPSATSTTLPPATQPSASQNAATDGTGRVGLSPSSVPTTTYPVAPQATASSGGVSAATWVAAAGTLLGGLGTLLAAIWLRADRKNMNRRPPTS